MPVKLLIGVSNEMNSALRRAADGHPLGPYVESLLAKSPSIRKAARELGIRFPLREKDGRGKYLRKPKD